MINCVGDKMVDVWLNGKFIGTVDSPEEFVENVKENRRRNVLPKNLNVRYDSDSKNIYIETSKGRVVRPLIVVKEGKPLLTDDHVKKLMSGEIGWNDLVKEGVIEYLDAMEEEDAYIAMFPEEVTPEHTHLEISPLIMYSYATSLMPYSNFNQAARLNIGCKNQQQGVGLYMANYHLRNDTDVHLLHEPQVPIVKTFTYGIGNYAAHPAGENVVVAVMTYEGYNMEDAVILNKGSVDRALFRSSYYFPFEAEEMRYSGGFVDKFCIPDKDVVGYKSEHAYRLLGEDGVVSPGTPVKEGDVVIGKVSPPRFLSSSDEYSLLAQTKRETSVSVSHAQKGIVDSVLFSESADGNRIVEVKVRDLRIPEIGDKFTSRHGQKGVVGMIVPQEEMPFTADGIVPDLLFTPFGIPGRMTISHILEILAGKTAAMRGEYVDATPYENEPEEELRKQLLALGFRDDGLETMYDGKTGRILKARIYVGESFYMRLKYVVANKMHARPRGKVQLLTRQPTEGRRKEGGLRLGEMEKDALVAYGASLLLNERFSSDSVGVPVCEVCGSVAIEDHINHRFVCPVCGETTRISVVQMSYSFKLFLDELMTLGIRPRLKLGKKYGESKKTEEKKVVKEN